ncbi:hypothetical protein FJZ27_02190 [Candidatus Peribacteria bacterium]|nr:hypothetical protein [Candidatus Peribacteria bacterium]
MRLVIASSLLALTISPAAFAVSAPAMEPEASIIRHGADLEWTQSADSQYPFAGEQKRYQERMAQEYSSWRNLWSEPLNPTVFAAQNRRVRRMLTAAHRRAVRTNDWDVFPRVSEGIDRASSVRPVERMANRPSRRLIVRKAERLNVLKTPTR